MQSNPIVEYREKLLAAQNELLGRIGVTRQPFKAVIAGSSFTACTELAYYLAGILKEIGLIQGVVAPGLNVPKRLAGNGLRIIYNSCEEGNEDYVLYLDPGYQYVSNENLDKAKYIFIGPTKVGANIKQIHLRYLYLQHTKEQTKNLVRQLNNDQYLMVEQHNVATYSIYNC